MSDQVQELLKRVYEEGVNKAKAEAEQILSVATQEAEALKTNAESEAQKIVENARKQAEELSRNNASDLKMAAQQTISVIKQKLSDVILDKVFDAKTSEAFEEAAFLQSLIKETVEAWKNSMEDGSLLISENMKSKLDEHFLASLKGIFSGKLHIDFSPAMKNGFTISPADGSYRLSFTDEDFANLFKSFLRPRTVQLLFKD